ncbi:hypothetical protein BDB13_6005 [Rhodococcus sp. OK302]|nr:hypothetical protein BDB13_6005 [Rhodococcus sp. OK302]
MDTYANRSPAILLEKFWEHCAVPLVGTPTNRTRPTLGRRSDQGPVGATWLILEPRYAFECVQPRETHIPPHDLAAERFT